MADGRYKGLTGLGNLLGLSFLISHLCYNRAHILRTACHSTPLTLVTMPLRQKLGGLNNTRDQNQFRVLTRPFLRWAGGKFRIVEHLLKFMPKEPYRVYREPFLGAGSLYFALKPKIAYLSDLNGDLIFCYQQIRDYPDLIYRYLRQHMAQNSESYYHDVRNKYNRSGPSVAQAARFIYLNKTSFNGIFRVNSKGQFNVPYGHRKNPSFESRQVLKSISRLLGNAFLIPQSYEIALSDTEVQCHDFIYLDPPYPPLSDTSYFTHYTAKGCSWDDQKNVAALAKRLKDNNCFVMISNVDTQLIRALYSDSDWHFHTIPVTRWIAANGSRHKVAELVITNYETLPAQEA